MDLWRDDFFQVTARVGCRSLHRLGVEPYSQALFKRGLKAWSAEKDGEENETLDRVMEYVGAIGVEVADMLASVHQKVWALEP